MKPEEVKLLISDDIKFPILWINSDRSEAICEKLIRILSKIEISSEFAIFSPTSAHAVFIFWNDVTKELVFLTGFYS